MAQSWCLAAKKLAGNARKLADFSVNVFKNGDNLFYAGLEPGNVDNNSTFIAVD
jgi:hypothetical protein